MREPTFRVLFQFRLIVLFLCLVCLPSGRAEDADRLRGYLHFRNGEFNSAWDVHDYWGLTLGLNFNRHWGVELAGDAFENYLSYGEMSVNTITPQARFRWPLLGDRLVPYIVAGAGPVFLQFNDSRGHGRHVKVDGEEWRAGLVAGFGLEYFLADSITFVTEGKYVWIDEMRVSVDGVTRDEDMSSFLASIGFRVYFDENRKRPLAEQEENVASRFSFGVRYGGSVLTDASLGSGLELKPEASSYGSLNQAAGLILGANFGQNWGLDLHLSAMEWRLAQDGDILGEYTTVFALPMARLRLPLQGGRWVPYVTTGVGMVYGEFNDGRDKLDVHANGFYPTVAVGGGIEYFVHRAFSIAAEGWWQYSWDHKFEVADQKIRGDFSSFQFHLGFRAYLFEHKHK